MKRFRLLFAVGLLAWLLAACGGAAEPQFNLGGEWEVVQTITESTFPGAEVGTEARGTITFATSGNEVTATGEGGITAMGTRSGNTITLQRQGTAEDLTFTVNTTLTLTSNATMTGTAIWTFSDGTRIVRNITGTRQ